MKGMARLRDWLAQRPWSVVLLLLPLLWVLPAVPVDETRYLSIAWEMRQTGSWITLHLDGQPYFDKPPLLFWLVNLAWSVLGVSLWSARAVSVLAGAACVALTAAIGRRLDARAAADAAWLLPVSLYFLLFSGVVMFDITLTFCVLLGYLAMLQWVQGGGRRALLLLFAASGLGMLVKGPVVLLHLAGPVLLSPWWAPAGQRPAWRRLGWPVLAALLGGVLVLLWALAALRGLGDADAYDLLVKQTAGRMVRSFAHRRAPWWYLQWILVILLPWPLVLRWKRLAVWSGAMHASSMARFGLCASLPAFIGFSLVSGKQLHYLLPCLPGLALLLGGLRQAEPRLLAPARLWWLLALFGGLLLWAVLRPGDMRPWPLSPAARIALVALSAVLTLLAGGVLHGCRSEWAGPRMALCVALLALASLPILRLQVLGASDLRGLARQVTTLQARHVPLARAGEEPGLVNFLARLPRPLPQATDPKAWASAHPNGYLLVWASHGKAPVGGVATTRVANGWASLLPAAAFRSAPGPAAE